MRVVVIGSPLARARLRRAVADSSLEIVDEASTIEAARERRVHADAFLIAVNDTSTGDQPLAEPLSAREVEVLELVAEGLANRVIADRLGISDQTVKFHVASICGKLGVANRTEAVRVAIRRGLISI